MAATGDDDSEPRAGADEPSQESLIAEAARDSGARAFRPSRPLKRQRPSV